MQFTIYREKIMFSTVREIVVIIGAAVGLLGTAIPLVVNLIRKSRQWARERDWNQLMNVLPELIIDAEQFVNYTGIEKKEYVKSRLLVYALKNKIVFDDRYDAKIDEIVRLTKLVNRRNKDLAKLDGIQNYVEGGLVSNNYSEN